MPALVTASDEAYLLLIWEIALIFVIISALILTGLVIARLLNSRKISNNAARQKELSRFFYAALSSPAELLRDILPTLSTHDKNLVFRLALDLLRTVKGGDQDKIIALLQIWDMQAHAVYLLKKGRRGQKIQALTFLSHIKNDESLALLLRYASSSDLYVQLAALRGLSIIDGTHHMDETIRALSVTGRTNKLMLSDILQRFGEPAVPALIALMQDGGAQENVRLAALIALGRIRSLDAVAPLIHLLKDSSSNIRAQAAATLGRIGDPRAARPLIQSLQDSSIPVRIQSARSLGLISADDSLLALAECLNDENWWIRFRAAEALYNLGSHGIAVLRATSARPDSAGTIAGQVLEEKGGSRAG